MSIINLSNVVTALKKQNLVPKKKLYKKCYTKIFFKLCSFWFVLLNLLGDGLNHLFNYKITIFTAIFCLPSMCENDEVNKNTSRWWFKNIYISNLNNTWLHLFYIFVSISVQMVKVNKKVNLKTNCQLSFFANYYVIMYSRLSIENTRI